MEGNSNTLSAIEPVPINKKIKMVEVMDNNTESLLTSLITSSQPSLNSETTIESFVNTKETPNSRKRPSPDSPQDLVATLKQETKQTRRRNSVGDLSQKKKTQTMADKVIEALINPTVLNQIVPILSEKIAESVAESINKALEKTINDHLKPLEKIINDQDKTIVEQKYTMQKQASMIVHICKINGEIDESLKERESEIEVLYRKINELELRVENQEQYSRRTSLRFHNIRVPLNNMGRIMHPVDTDSIILDICKNNLSITDMKKEDIGRSHVIGKPKDGKSQVIVRFLSYRVREKVYNSKKELKRHPDKIFITENLTQYRTNVVKALAELKCSRKIHAYWTIDGRIYLKTNENSRKMQIRNHDDIMHILRRMDTGVDRIFEDHGLVSR